jgi:hypothetical protein
VQLTKALFRSAVKTVGQGAFDGCPNLSDLERGGKRLANSLEGLVAYLQTLGRKRGYNDDGALSVYAAAFFLPRDFF